MNIWFEVGTYEIVFGIPNDLDEQIIYQLHFFIIVATYINAKRLPATCMFTNSYWKLKTGL